MLQYRLNQDEYYAYMCTGMHSHADGCGANATIYCHVRYMSASEVDVGSKYCSLAELCDQKCGFLLESLACKAEIPLEFETKSYPKDSVPQTNKFLSCCGMRMCSPRGTTTMKDYPFGWIEFKMKHSPYRDRGKVKVAGEKWFTASDVCKMECDHLLMSFWNHNASPEMRIRAFPIGPDFVEKPDWEGPPCQDLIEQWRREGLESESDEEARESGADASSDSEGAGDNLLPGNDSDDSDSQAQTCVVGKRSKAAAVPLTKGHQPVAKGADCQCKLELTRAKARVRKAKTNVKRAREKVDHARTVLRSEQGNLQGWVTVLKKSERDLSRLPASV